MTRKDILERAASAVLQDRNDCYGRPEDSFGCIALMWTAYLRRQGLITDNLDTIDVAAMMVLLKVARINPETPHIDNWVDIAGYAACGGECEGGEIDE